MNIVQITPGAGGMFCGNCIRDNALVAAMRQRGHHTLMVPLYLPLTLDEEDQTQGSPFFFGGINVYLAQRSAMFRKAPRWLRRWLASPGVLKWASTRASRTRPEEVSDVMISMLRGEEGNQARELDELLRWLGTQEKPHVLCLSNALLAGLARRLRSELGVPIVCTLQGEDAFLDSLPEGVREMAWATLVERLGDIDLFIAPSEYYAGLMTRRLGLAPDRLRVVPNGIDVTGYMPGTVPPHPAAVGFFARMCREKGLDTLVDAYIRLKKRNRIPHLKLRAGGSCGPAEEPFVEELREKLARNRCLHDVEFHKNLSRGDKLAFFRNVTVLSTPALYGEGFGLYVIEAMAAGVPVIQPRHGAFPEILEATGGGVLVEPGDSAALADALELLILDPERTRALGEQGRKAVLARFNIDVMATQILNLYAALSGQSLEAPAFSDEPV